MVTKVESGVTTNYKYDSENRLIEVKKGGTIIGQYTYDGDGGRTTKVATVFKHDHHDDFRRLAL